MTVSKCAILLAATALGAVAPAHAGDFLPTSWPAVERSAAETAEAAGLTAMESRTFEGQNAAISATASPVSVLAGLDVLRKGGNAADAATSIAMTQVTMQAGSVVSYAGIMSMVYYDAKTGKVYALDAGYNSYRGETDPLTIPTGDMGALNTKRPGTAGGLTVGDGKAPSEGYGRQTLVPGYMAGFEALHKKFGRFAWKDMFTPAIWYAENGIPVSPGVAGMFQWRAGVLGRTPEGKAFLHPGGRELPTAGGRFYQPDTAKTLRGVAKYGARYMYTGDWAKEYVSIVQREGGKVTEKDLSSYRVSWDEPLKTEYAGATIYAPGGTTHSGYAIIPTLNVIEELGLNEAAPYWQNPKTLVAMDNVLTLLGGAPDFVPETKAKFDALGIDSSREGQLTKEFARKVGPLVSDRTVVPPDTDDHHSNSIVVIDKEGNVAAITHTINAVAWGSSGVVVGGIPIPDSASFQQAALAKLVPGTRVPNVMIQTIAIKDGKPVLATASIGSGLVPESLKFVMGVLGQGKTIAEVQAAPPIMTVLALLGMGRMPSAEDIVVPSGSYSPEYLDHLRASGLNVTEIPAQQAAGLRGTVDAVAVDPKTGKRSTAQQAGVLVHGGAY